MVCPYTDNPENATRKFLELIHVFGKFEGHKINTEKSLTFLYTNNRKSEREIEKTIPFTMTSKRIKYLGINLPVKDDAVKVLHSICQQIWKLSSGHRTGKVQFSFQSQRKTMSKIVQTTTQLHSSHTLVK